jgi:hypothetical protein
MTAPLDAETRRLRAMTPAQLADEVGTRKATIATVDEQLEALKLECQRRGITEASGALFDITLTPPGERKSLDGTALLAEFGAQFVERFTRTTLGRSWTLRCTARKAAAARRMAA